jgi:hypothetical protein
MPSTLTLTPATDSADSATIAHIWSSAFADDTLDFAICGDVPGPARRAWAAPLVAAAQQQASVRLLKVTDDDTGEVIAFAMWEVVEAEGTQQQQEAGKRQWVRLPDGANQALSDAFQDALEALRRRHMRGRKYYCMSPPSPIILFFVPVPRFLFLFCSLFPPGAE